MQLRDKQPLSGVRVVNLGLHIAGPLACLLLEGAGAEVVHVVPPESLLPSERLPALIGDKRHLRLDLKTKEGRDHLLGLLERSDVLIEGFRPGVMTRLGLDLATLRDRLPRLVTCSIPGFASDDVRAPDPAWESAVMAAAGGLLPVMLDAKATLSDEFPRFPATPIASNFAGMMAAFGIVVALIARQRHGFGQGLEISLFDAVFEAIGDVGTWINDAGPDRNPRDRFGGGLYPCSDGRWVQFNTQNPEFLLRFADHVGLAEKALLDVDRLAFDAAYRASIKQLVATEFSRRPSDWWEKLGQKAEIALVACRTLEEWRGSAHARDAEIMPQADLSSPLFPGVRFSNGRALRENSVGSRTSTDNVAERPLGHVRVVDIGHYLAGPTAARILAQFGAEVVKLIEPTHRNLHKHDYVNRGKKTILVDLTLKEGQALLCDLLRCSDVFIHNFLPTSQRKLRITSNHVHDVNPDIVYASVSAYGEGGELSARPGYEVQGQAVSGMMLLADASRPVLHPFPVNDYGTGWAGALGIVCSLYAASDRGVVYDVDCSLARTATLFQACIRQGNKEAATSEALKNAWYDPAVHLQMAVKALDKWICICGPGAELCRLLTVAPGPNHDWPVESIAVEIGRCDLSYWQRRFAGTRISITAIEHLEDVIRDTDLRRRGVISDIENPELGKLTVPEPRFRFTRSRLWVGAPHARAGSHTAQVAALLDSERASH